MTDNSTSRRNKSRYSDKPITDAQLIVERLCENIAARNKEQLPYRFWQDSKWKKKFILEVMHANSLLQLFEASTILDVLASNRAKFFMTLKNAELVALFREKHKEKVAIESTHTPILLPSFDSSALPLKPIQRKKNKMDKLNEI